jgi:hypothetical protein
MIDALESRSLELNEWNSRPRDEDKCGEATPTSEGRGVSFRPVVEASLFLETGRNSRAENQREASRRARRAIRSERQIYGGVELRDATMRSSYLGVAHYFLPYGTARVRTSSTLPRAYQIVTVVQQLRLLAGICPEERVPLSRFPVDLSGGGDDVFTSTRRIHSAASAIVRESSPR